jgi:thiol-disulfide isomerase/thioredoxin
VFVSLVRVVTLVALGLVIVSGAGRADAATEMNVSLAGVHLGGHVAGPVATPDALAGRVVLLEFWGINCPPCIASMPKLEEMHRTFGPQGLVVIGAHAQGGTSEEIRAAVAKLGVTFTIVNGARVDGAEDIGGIPHCMLFDHTGKCVFRGHPMQSHDAVEAAVKVAPGAVLGGRVLAKMPDLNTLLQDERKFVTGWKKAKSLVSSDDAETAAEAKYVVERIESYGRGMLDEAVSAKQVDPVKALDLVQRCVVSLKGTGIGDEAAKLKSAWMKDKEFQAVVKASQQMERLEGMRSTVREQLGVGANGAITPELAATIPSAVKGRVRLLAQTILKAAPDTPLATKAIAIAAELGVAVES